MVKKYKDEMLFELDGKVYTVEKKNGKVVSREELDGELVLKSLVHVLGEALDALDSADKKATKAKKKKK